MDTGISLLKTVNLSTFADLLKKPPTSFSASCRPVITQATLTKRHWILTPHSSSLVERLFANSGSQLSSKQFPREPHLHPSSTSHCPSGHRAAPCGFQDSCCSLKTVLLGSLPAPCPEARTASHRDVFYPAQHDD